MAVDMTKYDKNMTMKPNLIEPNLKRAQMQRS